ncbi:DUF1572 family protein [Epilithonimonas arachidiradicis]|uniref:Uncharacterized protein DUF1572 n=1 Tax=Epilithonimonas arachidiradicis TaxID=1617282 RepID=A0A420DCG7_9FLAO|nr:DUF1572 family protein [Epilithonimonas arachidiradicis]RKE89484.1 uncharacterized protein DUF1572 [Epilithonimonas arachidiradicis]GGG42763.1 hypothetical protein GCM10007332_00410 [Epilithonimonas arachidiradicis]
MLSETLNSLFERDLNKVIEELNLYQSESNIWKVEGNISNSAGNLALHLIGNLKTYIGKEIGNFDYVRNRDLEFADKNVPRAKIVADLNDTVVIIKNSLKSVSDEELKKDYPLLVLGEKTSTEYFLVHLATHLNYHLGQINYHRRLVEK